jgi:hypothetical protein
MTGFENLSDAELNVWIHEMDAEMFGEELFLAELELLSRQVNTSFRNNPDNGGRL